MSNCENCIRKYVCKNYPVDSLPPNIRQTIFKKLDEECKEFISTKGCKYCKNISRQLQGHKDFGYAVLFEQIAVDEIVEIDIDINYCPHCGRKLGENDA